MTDAELSRIFRGHLTELSEQAPTTARPDPLDVGEMAARALNYLRGNPEPSRGYECKFSLGPLGIPCHVPLSPPNAYAFDPISLADTDCRMNLQYANMRAMAGEAEPDEVERGVAQRILGYQRDDHLCWANPEAFTGQPTPGEWASTWCSGKLLHWLCDRVERTGDEAELAAGQAIFEAIRALASWSGDRAFFPRGPAPWRDGEWLSGGWADSHCRNYPSVVEPIVRYWEVSGDEAALDFAVALCEGFLAGSQPDMGDLRIDPETGEFQGHVHLHTHALWGLAHLGAAIGETRFLDYVQRAYDFVWSRGTDYGWLPEFIPQGEYRTEVCVVGDMASLAAWLAKGGHPHYWDHLEQSVRNLLARSQFALTEPFVALFRELHRDRPEAEVAAALAELRRLEGGFVAQATFDDWVSYPDTLGQAGLNTNGIHMMGCCPPEGMRALYEAWSGTVQLRPDGVFVNLGFHRDHHAATVKALRPADGGYEVTAKHGGRYHLRPPAWAPRARSVVLRNGREARAGWGGPGARYLVVDRVRSGEVLSLRWPVPHFTQEHPATSVPGRDQTVTVRWVGNQVVGVEPAGRFLPMFGDPGA